MCISSISLSKMSLVNYVYSLEQSDLNTFSIWTKFVSALLKNNFRTHCVLLFYFIRKETKLNMFCKNICHCISFVFIKFTDFSGIRYTFITWTRIVIPCLSELSIIVLNFSSACLK